MIFANPDPAAPALSSMFGELGNRLEGHLAGPLIEVGCVSYEIACNWKFVVENHIDVYHLWYVHKQSLSMYDHRSFRWESLGNNWWSFEPRSDGDTDRDGFAWLSPGERLGIGAHLFFPNLMIVTTGQYFATYDVRPLAPDRTRLTLRVRAQTGADGAALIDSVRSFLAEDIAMCELLQRAASSERFALGPLAVDHEAPVRQFHDAVARACAD
jgi:Rieske 2Fe-2S family protein